MYEVWPRCAAMTSVLQSRNHMTD